MPEPRDTLHDLASQYAAGTLAPAEMERFEARLVSGDRDAIAAFEEVRRMGEAFLDDEDDEHEAPLIVRSNLINALGGPKAAAEFMAPPAAPDPFSEDPRAMVLMRGVDIDWRPTGVPGVESRNLFLDKEKGRVTVLLRLAPGVVYPDHEHDGVEECMVLEGDLELGGKVLRQWDYIRIPKGGQHGVPRTTTGCVLLVIAPLAAAA